MVRPIAETPILYAKRFDERMRKVDNMTVEEWEENTRKLEEAFKEATKTITIGI